MKAAKLKVILEAVGDFYGEPVTKKDPVVLAMLNRDLRGLNPTQRREVFLINKNLTSYPQNASRGRAKR